MSHANLLQLTMIRGTDVVSFGAQNLLFGTPAASTLAPRGTIDRRGAHESTRTEALGSRLGLILVWVDFGKGFSHFFDNFL